ncbi:MAG: hypothetical protein NVSMB64_23900 [Candidatus Velthaea sp.]
MIAGERKSLPESIGALFDTAFALYGRRFALYATVTLAGFIIQAAAAALFAAAFPHVLAYAVAVLNVIVDAFIAGVVTIGVLTDAARADDVSGNDIVTAASGRLLPLIVVNFLVALTQLVVAPVYAVPADLTLCALMLPIVAVIYGTLGFATVIAAGDTATSKSMLFVRSIGQSFRLALAGQNLGRTALLGLCVLPVSLLQVVVLDQMQVRHMRGFDFLANVPIDALVVGPLQAVFTVFYLDFVRRIEAAKSA